MIQEKRPRAAPKGRVITFYSYKGGTGRSMAMANVAWLLAMRGERVLVVDWDLEAPGLHRYFHPLLEDKELLHTEGLLDFVEKLSTRAAMSSGPLDEREVDVIEYVTMLKWPANFPVSWETFGDRAAIDLLVAGRQGPLYGKRLNAFNWVDFYEKLGGRRLLSLAREQMKGLYDYVLIDSRTGVSDTSGICTVEMPDTLVVCFTLNDQSIMGASGVAHDVLKQREAYLASIASASGPPSSPPSSGANKERDFHIFPVPTRVEMNGEQVKLQTALALARNKFAPFIAHLSTEARSRYWGGVQLTYFSFYAFEEIPAVFGDPLHQQISLIASILQIARAITGDDMLDRKLLSKEDDEADRLRKEILGWYLRKPDSGVLDPVELAQSAYDQSDAAGRQVMKRVMLRLVQAGGPTLLPAALEIDELGAQLERAARTLVDAGILLMSGTSVYIDRRVVERWGPLLQWAREDEAFLVWRQTLTVKARSWRSSGKDASGLLRGKFLQEAAEWVEKRIDDLNGNEFEFIAVSRQAKPVGASRFAIRLLGGWNLVFLLILVSLLVFPRDRVLKLGKEVLGIREWTAQTSGTTNRLISIFGTSDGKRLWAVGDNGTILNSGDGVKWVPQTSGTSNDLSAVFVTNDSKELWAVGDKGTILESDDGDHWRQRTSGNPNDLRSVFGRRDGRRLWVVGGKGTILQSDIGFLWAQQKSGTAYNLVSVFGTSDGTRLWAVGDHGTILESTDGATWTQQASGTEADLRSVFATGDGKRVWITVANGTILESGDGTHWAQRNTGYAYSLFSICGANDGKRQWAAGDRGRIETSEDGAQWIQQTSATANDLFSVFATGDGKRIWAAGFGGTIVSYGVK